MSVTLEILKESDKFDRYIEWKSNPDTQLFIGLVLEEISPGMPAIMDPLHVTAKLAGDEAKRAFAKRLLSLDEDGEVESDEKADFGFHDIMKREGYVVESEEG